MKGSRAADSRTDEESSVRSVARVLALVAIGLAGLMLVVFAGAGPGDGTLVRVLVGALFVAVAAIALSLRSSVDRLAGERARSEAALEQSRLRLRVLDELYPAGIFEADAGGGLVFASTSWARIAGVSPASAHGRGWERTVHPDDLERVRSAWAAAGGAQTVDLIYRLRHADGELREVEVHASANHDETGAVSGFIGVLQDVTERRRVEAERRLQSEIASNLAEGVCLVRVADWQVVYANHAFAEMFGYEDGELEGRPVEQLNAPTPRDPVEVAAEIQSALARDGRWKGEVRNVRKDGTTFWCRANVSNFEHPEFGTVSVAVHTDITAERRARSALMAAESLFRSTFEDAPIGMAIADLEGRFTEVNGSLARITGYDREQLRGISYRTITDPGDLAAADAALDSMRRGAAAGSRELELRCVHAGGQPVWVSMQVTLVRNEDGPTHFLMQVEDITERRRSEQRLRHLADHDPLTGLLNRRSFERELERHAATAARYGEPGAVLVLDIDNFKYYNDTLGHSTGDELIVRVAHVLASRLRETDVLARLGGDEFAVLLPKQDAAEAERVALDLVRRVSAAGEKIVGDDDRPLTASAGIAMVGGGAALSGEEVLVNADLAMYDAKEAGRNRISAYVSPERLEGRHKNRIRWASKIEHALHQGGFVLMAQPIVELETGKVVQHELLLRMRSGEGDLAPPGSFLYIAERLGFVQEIDRWVIGEAIKQLAVQAKLGREPRFEVNLSGHSIGDERLVRLIETGLAESGVPASSLVFEISEAAAVANVALARTFADQLSAIGCQFALDDFGAGYGSFYHLRHLPFDVLKIGGELVRNCSRNRTDRLLIEAAASVAHELGKPVVAELVGDAATVETLKELGIEMGQGFHLGVPVPLVDALDERVGSVA